MTLYKLLAVALLSAAVAGLSGRILFRAFRSGVVFYGRSYRRNDEPFNYWFVMTTGVVALLLFIISIFMMLLLSH